MWACGSIDATSPNSVRYCTRSVSTYLLTDVNETREGERGMGHCAKIRPSLTLSLFLDPSDPLSLFLPPSIAPVQRGSGRGVGTKSAKGQMASGAACHYTAALIPPRTLITSTDKNQQDPQYLLNYRS